MGIHPPGMNTVKNLVGPPALAARAEFPRSPNLPRRPIWVSPRLACRIAPRESFTVLLSRLAKVDPAPAQRRRQSMAPCFDRLDCCRAEGSEGRYCSADRRRL